MDVTLRPRASDVYIQNLVGEACGLAELDRNIRTLQAARRWLQKEIHVSRERAKQLKAQEKK